MLPPGSADVPLYVNSMTGERSWSRILPAKGDYAIRVYLNRPAARRSESSKCTMTIAVTGRPRASLCGATDAKVAGTTYHASAKVPCALPHQADVKPYDADVVRRRNDGTERFKAIGATGVQRRILLLRREPVAAEATDPLTATRQGDATIVEASDNERYDIPDVSLNLGERGATQWHLNRRPQSTESGRKHGG